LLDLLDEIALMMAGISRQQDVPHLFSKNRRFSSLLIRSLENPALRNEENSAMPLCYYL